ncbi:NUDIX domain-containing protein [Candidatus Nanohaloarchaea archaeon]|nr:NUDIX domain-containing protein [Candidatus Nanohaloarchaea archaeon]
MITVPEADYCPVCGTELGDKEVEGRKRLFCSSCDQVIWRNPKPAAGVLLQKDSGEILLVKRGNWPNIGTWSIPAGFIEQDERPVKAAARELGEETSLEVDTDDLELVGDLMVQHPDGKYVIVITFSTDISSIKGELSAGDDAQEARFWNLEDIQSSEEELESEALESFLQENSRD